MRRHAVAAAVALTLGAWVGPAPTALAGAPPAAGAKPKPAKPRGPTVLSWIDLAEAVERSPFIFQAKVLKVDPDWRTARRSGKRYLASHRLEVALGMPWRGHDEVEALRKRHPTVWLQRKSSPPWAKLHDVYRTRYPIEDAKAGDEVIVMVRTLTPMPDVKDRTTLLLQYLDRADIASLLGPAVESAELGRREAARREASCPTPGTYYFKKKCVPSQRLFDKVDCPPGTKLNGKLDDERPRLWCVDAQERASGPALAWRANGDIDHRGEMLAGDKHGTWTNYGARGVLEFRRDYVQGKLHGPATWFHRNGKPKLTGAYAAGLADGVWKQLSKGGKVLGRFQMKSGTGTQRRWYEDGQLEREEALVAGVADGPIREWHPNGQLRLEGQHERGLREGLFRVLKADGGLKRAVCYRDGMISWETATPDVAWPDQCTLKRKK